MQEEHIYHLYPLGYCGANQSVNDGISTMTLKDISAIIPHLKSLNVTTLLLGPLFESESHGYDTTDYKRVDRRLGTNHDLRLLVDAMHEEGIKVMLDCVFNHIARSHDIFQSIRSNRETSPYINWVKGLDFAGNNSFNDGFGYENWDGHDILVKLNLDEPAVKSYLIAIAENWVNEFDIDGLRMDAADVMSKAFLKALSHRMRQTKKGFMMLGEVVHGDYNHWIEEGSLGAVTNYEVYKGLYSSLNDRNYFEIAYAMNRQFGATGAYRHETMVNFTDNHDVDRVASKLQQQRHLYPLYVMLYTMPGVPALYYGSEYGISGTKGIGTDAPLRPTWQTVEEQVNDSANGHPLKDSIARLSQIRMGHKALKYGGYKQIYLDHGLIGYERNIHDQRIMIFVNADEAKAEVPVPMLHGNYIDVLNDEPIRCDGRIDVYGNWGRILVPVL